MTGYQLAHLSPESLVAVHRVKPLSLKDSVREGIYVCRRILNEPIVIVSRQAEPQLHAELVKKVLSVQGRHHSTRELHSAATAEPLGRIYTISRDATDFELERNNAWLLVEPQ